MWLRDRGLGPQATSRGRSCAAQSSALLLTAARRLWSPRPPELPLPWDFLLPKPGQPQSRHFLPAAPRVPGPAAPTGAVRPAGLEPPLLPVSPWSGTEALQAPGRAQLCPLEGSLLQVPLWPPLHTWLLPSNPQACSGPPLQLPPLPRSSQEAGEQGFEPRPFSAVTPHPLPFPCPWVSRSHLSQVGSAKGKGALGLPRWQDLRVTGHRVPESCKGLVSSTGFPRAQPP